MIIFNVEKFLLHSEEKKRFIYGLKRGKDLPLCYEKHIRYVTLL